ncbi:MAG: ABC transporter permease [Verrucomicrobia bacterium]|nr:ABC transporter permease [Verrucomicrobiota bacterium]
MNWRSISVVYRKELIDSLRDRRTIISMIVIPVLVMPLLSIGMGGAAVKLATKAAKEIPEVMVLGGEDSPKLMVALKKSDALKIVPPRADFTNQIADKVVRAAVKIPAGFDRAVERGERTAVPIYYYEGEMKSQMGAERLEQFFRTLRDTTVRERLQARSLPADLIRPFDFSRQNVAPPQKVSGNLIGALIPYFVILLCLTGAMYPAMDLAAGEKERGTIETLLCSPVARSDLVLGKFLLVFTASIATAVFSLCSMGATFAFAKSFLISGAAKQSAILSLSISAKSLFAFFVMMLPLAVLFSAAQFAIALFAKSFREAQSYLGPLMMVVILPAVGGLMPGVELNAGLALIPVLNTSLVSKEIFTGTFHWGYLALIFSSSCVYAALALAAAVAMFKRESVLFRA